MANLEGGEQRPRIYDRTSLKHWLEALPPDRQRQTAVAIAARAALRVLPLIAREAGLHASLLRFAALWSSAMARIAARFPNRTNHLSTYAVANSAAMDQVAVAAAIAAEGANYVTIMYHAVTCAADAVASAADAAASAAGAMNAADIWTSTTSDVEELERGRQPNELSGDPLWSRGAPDWAKEHWARLHLLPSNEYWKPWLDWYRRRLEGEELSEEIELLFSTLPVNPEEKAPAEQNALLAQEIARLTPPSPPEIPGQGAGPHVEINTETGAIVPARPESLDADGNNVARLRALHPQVLRLAHDLAASVSANEQPELHGSASRYANNVDRSLAEIDFDQLWGEGVFLEARAAAAAKGASDGMREPLDAGTLGTLNALLKIHGPFILSSSAGVENLALSREFHQQPEDARTEEAATLELAREFKKSPEIVSPETAQLFEHIAEQPASSVHPERSGAFKAGMTQNMAIVLLAGAGIRVMRLLAGDDASKPFADSLKESQPYLDYLKAAGLLKDKLDQSTDVDLKKVPLDLYRKFVLKHESLLRRALGDREQARWLHEHIDWLKCESEKRK